jgi:hypothetical protein
MVTRWREFAGDGGDDHLAVGRAGVAAVEPAASAHQRGRGDHRGVEPDVLAIPQATS